MLPSQTSSVVLFPTTTNVAFQTYNGCGLPLLPDYTYRGCQAPCVTTTNGQVETRYPILPASDSSSFFGGRRWQFSPCNYHHVFSHHDDYTHILHLCHLLLGQHRFPIWGLRTRSLVPDARYAQPDQFQRKQDHDHFLNRRVRRFNKQTSCFSKSS